MSLNDDARRARWLKAAKNIVLKLIERDERFRDLCPRNLKHAEDEDVSETRWRVAGLGDEILKTSHEMAGIEAEDGAPLGCKALFGEGVDMEAWVRPAISVLCLMNLFDDLSGQCHKVGQFAELLSGRDPEVALRIRESFRIGGLLRNIAIVQPDSKLDRFSLDGLTEEAFCKCLGLPENLEATVIGNMEGPSPRRR